jgi:hypothetical protein
MPRPLTNAERQRKYIARLKAQAAPSPDLTKLEKELAHAKERIATLEAKLAKRPARAR